jgi:predicted HNH restriction endonuclease
LGSDCASCSSSEGINMHHLKHIKTLNLRLNAFDSQLAAINRKQVPLCSICHRKVHAGKYDGMSLKHLADKKE